MTNELLIQTETKAWSRPPGRVSSVLSVTCAVFAFIVFLCSLWLMEGPHEGYMAGVFATAYGSIGLVITLAFALTGIALGIIWIRKNRAMKEAPAYYMGLSRIVLVLITSTLLFLIALPWLLLHGDLS